MIAGYQHLYALRGERGLLCHRWWASDRIGILLFVSSKDAAVWAKEVNKLAIKHNEPTWVVKAQVTMLSEVSQELQLTINPSDEYADVRRILSRVIWQN